jgi:outer membrane biosynthesis protein TonB
MVDMKRTPSAIVLLLALILVACAPQTAELEAAVTAPVMTAEVAVTSDALPPPEVATETIDRPSTEVPAVATASLAEPAVAPEATATATTPDESPGEESPVVYGRTDEGAYFHGAADAPVTLIDYSDFL